VSTLEVATSKKKRRIGVVRDKANTTERCVMDRTAFGRGGAQRLLASGISAPVDRLNAKKRVSCGRRLDAAVMGNRQ
jgi:hypothetical protein